MRRLKKIKINAVKAKKAIEEILQLVSMQPKSIKKIKIRPKTSVIANTIPVSKKVTMLISILRSQKTSIGFSNFHVNDWESKNWTEIGNWYPVFNNLLRYCENLTRLKKQSQYNKFKVCLKARP